MGVAFSLYGKRAGKSFELGCFLLHARLVLVLTEVCFHDTCGCVYNQDILSSVDLDFFCADPLHFRSRGGHAEEIVMMMHVYWSYTPTRR